MARKKQLDSVEKARKDAVKIALIRHGLKMADLAAACGVTPKYFSEKFHMAMLCEEMRALVEKSFHYQEPIWSTARDLTLRKSCFNRTGTDPATLKKPKLVAFSRNIGVAFTSDDTKAQILEKTLEFIAANPSKPLTKAHETTV